MKKTMLALALLSVATAAHAENGVLPMAGKPEDVGLSSAQLKRLEEVTQKHVDSGLVPGAVMLVEQLVGIYMVQANAEDTRFLRNQFRSMVQAAIDD